MSSQDDFGVSFGISNNQQSFRLLQLPTPLLALLASEHPPILHLKSAPTHSTPSGSPAPSAVVCTYDRTFEVRQVQSSNILYVLQSSLAVPTEHEYPNTSGVTAIGQCKALLELVPMPTAPTPFLRDAIPMYSSSQSFAATPHIVGKSKSKHELLADSPFSTGEFEMAWTDLCAFEIESQAWWPSAVLLHNIWTSFVTFATAEGIDLTSSFEYTGILSMIKEDGNPKLIYDALFKRLNPDKMDLMDGWIHIDSGKCIPWLGEVMLTSLCQTGSIQTAAFVKIWQDGLPEEWRDSASLDLLEGLFTDLGDGLIMLKSTIMKEDKPSTQIPASTTVTSTSKWHEKFRATRK
ncbi:hypothetical protein MMC13_005437 [Lambiella insularis]|nr:hypothetical protein [Lambiella insularis]